jgi:hypothetical protein
MILFKMWTRKLVKDGTSQIPHTLLYEIITVRRGYFKFCARRVLKMLMGAHKTQRMALALTFLEQYHKDGDEFLNHIV